MNKIAAVVVTFNRLELLKKVIGGICSQTHQLDAIIVVNNSSSDGTAEWLGEQADVKTITQENLGSSGGQFAGSKAAYELGFDYIWIMDDDVVAENDCLDILFQNIDKYDIVCPLRYNAGEPYLNDVVKLNMTNPFKSIWAKVISKADIAKPFVAIEGFTFEGPLFSRQVFENIGFPEKGFFIYADDTEFSVRSLKAGLKAVLATNARLDRLIPPLPDKTDFSWKHYYLIRNLIAIDKLHGSWLLKSIRPLGYLFIWLGQAKGLAQIKTVFRAFLGGIRYRS